MSALKLIVLIAAFGDSIAQKSCQIPDDIPLSRTQRLHHPCESNQNQYFAIETHEDFYCVFYSTLGIFLFGAETKVEITVKGSWSYEQFGADEFQIANETMKFTATSQDVTILIRRTNEKLPTISSVMITDGALPGEQEKQEYCNCDCGVRSESVPVIVGGSEAPEGAWPWNVAIYHRPRISNLNFRCGASIINKRTLITTATCLVTSAKLIQPKHLLVAVRETRLFGPAADRLNVQQVKLYEDFKPQDSHENSLKFDYNVGLLILEKEIKFSFHVAPICLPDSSKFDFRGKTGVVVGWGLDKNHQLSQKLQQLEAPTYPFLECFYRNREFFSGHSARRNFCAGYADNANQRGICSGDSGGGLVIKHGGKYVLFGLSSFANCRCVDSQTCEIFDEGIFINVPFYVQWIHNNQY